MAGEIVHVEIPADDTQKGRDFWGGLFGWQFEAFPGPSEYHMFRIGETQGGAIMSADGLNGIRPYFSVDDINAGAAKVKELGGSANDAMPVPSMGWFATCKDANGNDFGLWQTDPNAPTPEM
jgi:predicted enzyme related to lactoylglutathione lyase